MPKKTPESPTPAGDEKRSPRADWSREKKGGRPMGLRGPLRELAERLGGRAALAREIGVSDRQVWVWSSGRTVPKQPTRLLLAALARFHGVEPPFAVTPECPRPAWLDEESDEDDTE